LAAVMCFGFCVAEVKAGGFRPWLIEAIAYRTEHS
jgi:hypothetical protein